MTPISPRLRAMLDERRIASVATIDPDGMPHLTAVWFLFEGGEFYLTTPAHSAKMRHLAANPRLALMIDTRVPYEECGVTVQGEAEIVTGDPAREFALRIHQKYIRPEGLADPAVGGVFHQIDDVAIRLRPQKFFGWDMAELDQLAFGGAISKNDYLFELLA